MILNLAFESKEQRKRFQQNQYNFKSDFKKLASSYSDSFSNENQFQTLTSEKMKFFHEQSRSLNKIIENSLKVQKQLGDYLKTSTNENAEMAKIEEKMHFIRQVFIFYGLMEDNGEVSVDQMFEKAQLKFNQIQKKGNLKLEAEQSQSCLLNNQMKRNILTSEKKINFPEIPIILTFEKNNEVQFSPVKEITNQIQQISDEFLITPSSDAIEGRLESLTKKRIQLANQVFQKIQNQIQKHTQKASNLSNGKSIVSKIDSAQQYPTSRITQSYNFFELAIAEQEENLPREEFYTCQQFFVQSSILQKQQQQSQNIQEKIMNQNYFDHIQLYTPANQRKDKKQE